MQQKYTHREFTRVSMRTAEIAFYHGGILYPTSPDREPDNSVNGWIISRNNTETGIFLSKAIDEWKDEHGEPVCHLYMNTDDATRYTSEYLFKKVVCQVDGSRGAPMGRFNKGVPTYDGDNIANWAAVAAKRSVYERHVPLTEGYDAGGAYWGLGAPLYVRYSADLNHVEFFRRQYYEVTCNQTARTMASGHNATSLKAVADAFREYFRPDTEAKVLRLPTMQFIGYILANEFTIESSDNPFPEHND